MKWGKHLFDKVRSSASSVSQYRQREAYAKRDLLKQMTKNYIDHDRAYGHNTRNQNDNTQQWKNDITRRMDKITGVTGIRGLIKGADRVFGENTNWGSLNYKQPYSHKVDSTKRYVNEFVKSFSNKSIFTEQYKHYADYGRDFIRSMNVQTGILNDPYLGYKDWD